MIRVIQYGLGPIGIDCARGIVNREGLRLVGAVEVDPAKLGLEIGELLGSEPSSPVVVGRSEDVIAAGAAEVAVVTTVSSLGTIRTQLEELIDAGIHIVSSAEELFFPWLSSPEIAHALDHRARDAGVVVLGTGVNPGFVLDALPVALTLPCRTVNAVRAERVVDLRKRRLPLQHKMGVGLALDEFHRKVEEGALGHRGLPESVAFIADALGWALDDIREKVHPIVAETQISAATSGLAVERGGVAGIDHLAVGLEKGRERVRLTLQMYMGAESTYDRVHVDGDPPLQVAVDGGVPGDQATTAALLNAIPAVLEAEPGLRTVKDLPLPRCRSAMSGPR